MNNRSKGNVGEDAAVKYLRKNKYKILDRQFRCPIGEIDVVCVSPEGMLVFVEVKSRASLSKGLPREAVTPKKQQTIIRCAENYMMKKSLVYAAVRFDVVEVYSDGINHITDAFRVS